MTEIVLRVRLVGGDHPDVIYDEADARTDDIVDHAIADPDGQPPALQRFGDPSPAARLVLHRPHQEGSRRVG